MFFDSCGLSVCTDSLGWFDELHPAFGELGIRLLVAGYLMRPTELLASSAYVDTTPLDATLRLCKFECSVIRFIADHCACL